MFVYTMGDCVPPTQDYAKNKLQASMLPSRYTVEAGCSLLLYPWACVALAETAAGSRRDEYHNQRRAHQNIPLVYFLLHDFALFPPFTPLAFFICPKHQTHIAHIWLLYSTSQPRPARYGHRTAQSSPSQAGVASSQARAQ